MSVVIEIHPEELFDRRDRLGVGLSPAERARLEAHLALCSACEIEEKLRADFARELNPR